MDRQHVTEGTPLFSSPTRRDRHDDSTRERSTRESSTRESSTRDPPVASPRLGLAMAMAFLLLIMLVEIGATLVSTPMSQIQEAIICKVHHPDTSEPSTDARCKDQGVQSELSTLQGWELTFGLLPGLLTAVPYGIAADRYGRRVILSLSLLGFALVQATDAVICEPRFPSCPVMADVAQRPPPPSRLVSRHFPSSLRLARCDVDLGRRRPFCLFCRRVCHCK